MNTGFWVELAKGLLQPHGIRTLMALTGRCILVLGGVAAAIVVSPGELSQVRVLALVAVGGLAFLYYLIALLVGVVAPKSLHYGAEEFIRQSELEHQFPRYDAGKGSDQGAEIPKRRGNEDA